MRNTLNCTANNSVRRGGDSEAVWLDIHKGTDKLTFRALYRPLNLSRQDTDILLQEISGARSTGNVCVVGDFNFRGIN